jgi:hypothetical protein
MTRTMLASTVMLCAIATQASAATMEQMAQSVINARGHDCPRVTSTKALGTTESGTPLVAAACSNGQRHVLTIEKNDTFKYLTSCSAFETATKKKCF